MQLKDVCIISAALLFMLHLRQKSKKTKSIFSKSFRVVPPSLDIEKRKKHTDIMAKIKTEAYIGKIKKRIEESLRKNSKYSFLCDPISVVEFGSTLKGEHFELLDASSAFLNHGSYGLCLYRAYMLRQFYQERVR